MLRNRAVALFLSCTASSLAFALGLGSLESDSSLNEPFSGRIDILGAAPEDFDTLTVTLADAEQFARAGIERNPALFGLRFAIDDSVPGEDFIRVTSKDPIREPYLNFLVELNWANGRLVREYTVLLDPPLYDPDRRRAVFAPAPATPPVAAAPAPAVPPATPASQPPAAALPAASGAYVAGREIGPVVATDTLWSIASAARPHDGITVQQMMLALLRANPEAFGEDNVNLLRRGAVLRLPAQDELTAMDARAAYAEVQRHNQLWERYRGQVAAEPETQPVGAAAPSTAFDLGELEDDSARLELVAPGDDAEGDSTPGRAGEGGGAELLREEVEARAQQAAELESKLVEAEGIIDLLQRQVNIKDEELAALQARLAELGVAQDDLDLGERAEALADDAREALAELDEAAPEAPGVEPGTTLDDVFGDDLTDEEPAADGAVPQATAAGEEPATETTTADEPAAAPAAEKAAADEPAPAKPKPAPEKVAPPQPERAFPANLVPEHIAALVPGGSLTVLGAGALLVLGIIIGLVTSIMRRRGGKAEAPAAAAPAAAAATMPPAEEEDASEAPTEVGASDVTEEPTSFDPNATVEAESDETPEEFLRTQTDVAAAPTAEQEEDPLEEVNVYLAYERFDQAEELVKRVIAEYPDRHEYKLRLLEVYYSSNDRAAYESAARDLLDAVGEDDPLWSSALAMWAEMSPERALFAEGADEAAALAADTGPAFVDITAEGEAESPAESTLVQAPGEADDNALDFDLTGTGEEDSEAGGEAADDMFDITAAADDEVLDLTAGDDADVLDLTAAADEEVLDLTAGDAEEAADAAFDLTGTPESPADEDVLDITGGGESDETLKLQGDSAAGVHDLGSLEDTHDPANDLLDVTSSGEAGDFDDDNLLDLGGSLAGGDAEALDFDISDTVAPLTGADEETGGDEAAFDITGGGDDTDLLDFDIGGFDEEESPGDTAFDTESTAELGAGGAADSSLDITGDLGGTGDIDLELTRGMDEVTTRLDVTENEGEDGGLEITLSTPGGDAPDGELSLQGDELDELSLGGDDEFDLSLENTSDMDSIAAEETMEIPAGGLTSPAGEDDLGDFELDLPLPGEDETGGGGADGAAHTDTVELAGDDALEIDLDEHSTVVLPQGADVERQSSIDEADTKLNLAKAYIELGDNEGARSILAEVVSDGSDAQKAEAQSLLEQMSD